MKIKSVDAVWLHSPIAEARQHVSDFGRHTSFDTALVKIETDAGIVGWGEAKAAVGGTGVYRALVGIIRDEIAPLLVGRDPRDPARVWEALYNRVRAHYALAAGHVFPDLARRGLTISALSGIDIALWDILGKITNQPIARLLGGGGVEKVIAYVG
ncbi:MAG: mandelate racemase/muconate lactonizing enzyme family protein, partial [Deltaproteobacteria bacterium]|nr:mandelate racemase/muconate lactonizing enzyme family protein [Deltaproteobacteria bacterium]